MSLLRNPDPLCLEGNLPFHILAQDVPSTLGLHTIEDLDLIRRVDKLQPPVLGTPATSSLPQSSAAARFVPNPSRPVKRSSTLPNPSRPVKRSSTLPNPSRPAKRYITSQLSAHASCSSRSTPTSSRTNCSARCCTPASRSFTPLRTQSQISQKEKKTKITRHSLLPCLRSLT